MMVKDKKKKKGKKRGREKEEADSVKWLTDANDLTKRILLQKSSLASTYALKL